MEPLSELQRILRHRRTCMGEDSPSDSIDKNGASPIQALTVGKVKQRRSLFETNENRSANRGEQETEVKPRCLDLELVDLDEQPLTKIINQDAVRTRIINQDALRERKIFGDVLDVPPVLLDEHVFTASRHKQECEGDNSAWAIQTQQRPILQEPILQEREPDMGMRVLLQNELAGLACLQPLAPFPRTAAAVSQSYRLAEQEVDGSDVIECDQDVVEEPFEDAVDLSLEDSFDELGEEQGEFDPLPSEFAPYDPLEPIDEIDSVLEDDTVIELGPPIPDIPEEPEEDYRRCDLQSEGEQPSEFPPIPPKMQPVARRLSVTCTDSDQPADDPIEYAALDFNVFQSLPVPFVDKLTRDLQSLEEEVRHLRSQNNHLTAELQREKDEKETREVAEEPTLEVGASTLAPAVGGNFSPETSDAKLVMPETSHPAECFGICASPERVAVYVPPTLRPTKASPALMTRQLSPVEAAPMTKASPALTTRQFSPVDAGPVVRQLPPVRIVSSEPVAAVQCTVIPPATPAPHVVNSLPLHTTAVCVNTTYVGTTVATPTRGSPSPVRGSPRVVYFAHGPTTPPQVPTWRAAPPACGPQNLSFETWCSSSPITESQPPRSSGYITPRTHMPPIAQEKVCPEVFTAQTQIFELADALQIAKERCRKQQAEKWAFIQQAMLELVQNPVTEAQGLDTDVRAPLLDSSLGTHALRRTARSLKPSGSRGRIGVTLRAQSADRNASSKCQPPANGQPGNEQPRGLTHRSASVERFASTGGGGRTSPARTPRRPAVTPRSHATPPIMPTAVAKPLGTR